MYKLLELERKFENTGINGNPVITDNELRDLARLYHELREYFSAKGERIMSSYFLNKKESVINMWKARGVISCKPCFVNKY
jgi:hypothetical protein